MPRDLFKTLGRAWVVGRQLRISKLSDHPTQRDSGSSEPRKPRREREAPVATPAVLAPKVKKPRKPKKPKVVDPELQQIVDEATQLIENV
jgi:hypothetical protein